MHPLGPSEPPMGQGDPQLNLCGCPCSSQHSCYTNYWTPLPQIRPMSAPNWPTWTPSQTARHPTRPTGPPQCPRTTNKAHVSPLFDLHEPALRPHDTRKAHRTPHKAHGTPTRPTKPQIRFTGPPESPCSPHHKAFELQLQLSSCVRTFRIWQLGTINIINFNDHSYKND